MNKAKPLTRNFAGPARLLYMFIFQTLLMYGCTSVYLKSTVVKLEPISCNPGSLPNQIYTFWETDTIDFKYRRIGLVEVTGRPESTFDDLHDNLLLQARNVCANALIHVYQEPAFVWNSSLHVHEKKTKITGIAVRVDENDSFKTMHANKRYSHFKERLQQAQHERSDPVGSFFLNTLCLSMLCIAIIYGLGTDQD